MRFAGMLLYAMLLLAQVPTLAQDTAAWPHAMTGPQGGTVTVYQPQAIAWPEQKSLTARMALAITPKGAKAPVLGTLELTFATATDNATHMVTLTDPKLAASHFPSLDTAQAEQFEQRIGAALATLGPKRVPLDAIVLSLKEVPSQDARPVAVKNDPPVIFHADRPASLVVFDGEPVLTPAGGSGLKVAVNTNWEVFFDPAGGGMWYLLNNGIWLAAPAATGPYKPVNKLPAAFSRLPAETNFAGARRAMPAKPVAPNKVPTIFVSTKPAEIIVIAGAPQFEPIPGTGLQYVRNTVSDVFLDPGHGRFYYLVSGRWFAAQGLDGPWSFATDSLPPDFGLIPPDSAKGHVLASVPGTVQAQLAVLKAQIPQQATLKKSAARVTVTYAATPEFKPIPGTELTYAVNTAFEVISAGGKYYVCYHGAWFVGPSPNGPWSLAESVPHAIYTIPPSSPLYNVTYVTVYGSTPETVTYGYTSGYTLGYVAAGVVVYGTGYYYPPYVVPGVVPVYYPHPYSYAGSVWYISATGAWARGGTVYGPYGGAVTAGGAYNPATGAWAHGAAVYGPYGGAGAWSAYNPSTGTYAHGSAAWGPNGGTAHASFDNPRYGVSGSTTQNANAYSRWGSSTVTTPKQTINTASGSNARGSAGAISSSSGTAAAGVHTTTGNNAGVARTASGNVYAGADGNVYKHTDNGWQKWNSGWQTVQPPADARKQSSVGSAPAASRETFDRNNFQQLEQDRFARFQGAQGRFGGFEGRAAWGRFRR